MEHISLRVNHSSMYLHGFAKPVGRPQEVDQFSRQDSSSAMATNCMLSATWQHSDLCSGNIKSLYTYVRCAYA